MMMLLLLLYLGYYTLQWLHVLYVDWLVLCHDTIAGAGLCVLRKCDVSLFWRKQTVTNDEGMAQNVENGKVFLTNLTHIFVKRTALNLA